MKYILLILSIIIYASYGIENCGYILFSILTSFFVAKHLKGKDKKVILALVILVNVFISIWMKIAVFKNQNILVPLGISYYTLQVISYLVDVYRGKYEYEKNLIDYSLYIMYIPHLFIGPIYRYDEMKEQLNRKGKITFNNILNGAIRVIWGLSKKLIIAGRIAIVISTISSNASVYNGAYALFAMLLYSIQLYSDFGGGIDIVMGVSKMLGIEFKENFDRPFLAESIKEFWRRWHISLSSWLRDYVYIPLGGNRCGKIRKTINVLITFCVSGIWHGVNYGLWGIMHGIFVLFGDNYKTKRKSFNIMLNFIIVSLSWAFFIWQGNLNALKMIGTVFTNFNLLDVCSNVLNLGLVRSDWIILIVSTVFLFIVNVNRIGDRISKISIESKISLLCAMTLIVLVFGIYGIGFDVNEFIYSKF